ncbi:hypothetical protein P152DRAFT_1607 [Eremomyces bilateralis CBS 781.70]|uniref:Uncharacterized protein n=1 Tax=Eremomyces bilateralis CBS 781.70 TaxID=1392243 RepID=A0A6G1GG32_9PEZI|nr:uncharacterized protein P152DRAFT_1607 [Eremomyces bilateralis CBS 781.70]KAF1816820.1 hypothetical protein P152DRAFT_1607 [Eremomyces bilateralis CBS 781.70]
MPWGVFREFGEDGCFPCPDEFCPSSPPYSCIVFSQENCLVCLAILSQRSIFLQCSGARILSHSQANHLLLQATIRNCQPFSPTNSPSKESLILQNASIPKSFRSECDYVRTIHLKSRWIVVEAGDIAVRAEHKNR